MVTINSGINDFQGLYLDQYNVIYPEYFPYNFKTNMSYIVKAKWRFLYATDEFIIK